MQVHVYHTDAEDLKTVLYRTYTARPKRTHVWGMLPSLLDEAWVNDDGIATLTLFIFAVKERRVEFLFKLD